MADVKKYYWLKLQKDFFKRHDIRIIEDMPNGKDYILFYMKLLVESIAHEGNLRFSETIPYSDSMLATITNTNIDIVRSAVKIFTELKLMDILDDGTFYMMEIDKMVGNETEWAKTKRLYREKISLLEGQKRTMSNKSKSKSKSIELEKDIKDTRHKYGEFQNVLLSDDEMQKLKDKYPDINERIERLSLYISSKGAKYKSHYATIISWARKDTKEPQGRRWKDLD